MTATEAPSPRRYANGIARRRRILDASLQLFVEVGFGAATMRQIAASAELSTPGLLRHFADKDEILFALIRRFEEANSAWLSASGVVDAAGASEDDLVALARHNAGTPGYTALFATLAGEATAASHPAHDFFRARYERLRSRGARSARLAGRPLDATAEATRFTAGWDGLQIQSLYSPDVVDVVAHLRAHLDAVGGRSGPPFARPGEALALEEFAAAVVAADSGYAPGRERRALIVDAAMHAFSTGGFHGTSLREIGERTGIPKSTLIHHFATKDELLAAVLVHRDATTIPQARLRGASARDELLGLADGADANASAPGLIEMYAVLSCEGAAPEHPAHAYFEKRMRQARASLVGLFERAAAEGFLAPGRDPVHEAVWLLALWDGLQLQWLYDRDAVDVGWLLRGHLRSLLVPDAGTG